MKITKFIGKDGRQWFCGSGTHEEVEALNMEKDFNAALDTLNSIRNIHNDFFDKKDTAAVDRTVYGTRKAI